MRGSAGGAIFRLMKLLDTTMADEGRSSALEFPTAFPIKVMGQRTDDFGGSLRNRCRFGLMVFEEMRRQAGDDYIMGIRTAMGDPMTKAEIEAYAPYAADMFLRGCGYKAKS